MGFLSRELATQWGEGQYDRYHHSVNYHPFKGNEPIYVDGYDPSTNIDETSLFELEKVRIR